MIGPAAVWGSALLAGYSFHWTRLASTSLSPSV